MGSSGVEQQTVTNRKWVPVTGDDTDDTTLNTIDEFTPGMADIWRSGWVRFQRNQDGFGTQWG